MKQNKLTLLIIVLFINSFIFNAQNKRKNINIDSVYHELKNLPNTKSKVDKLIDLYKRSIRQRNIRKDVLDDALIISEKIYYLKGIGVCYNRKGITARHEQKYGQSVMYHKKSISFLKNAKDTFHLAKCYNSLGVTYRKLNLEKEAFENYLQGLDLSKRLKNNRGESIALNGIGNVFLNIQQYDKALMYFKEALKVNVDKSNTKNKEYGYANIGEVYLFKKEFDSAYYYFNKSYELALKHKRQENIAIKNVLFGKYYLDKGDFQMSKMEYEKSIPVLKKYKNSRYLSKALISLGIAEAHLKKFESSYKNITNGLSIGRQINSKENINLGYDALVEYYSAKKEFKRALLAHKQARIFHDSIVNVASQASIISTRIAYETEEKDKEIHTLALDKELSEEKAKNNFKRFIITAVISLISIAFLLMLLYLYRRNSDLELQQKNAELQNYILKISELKDQAKNSRTTDAEISKSFKSFNLSKREIEVLTHISNGLNNEEISEKMFVSKNTIKTHITHIYAKLDVKNRVQAIQKVTNS